MNVPEPHYSILKSCAFAVEANSNEILNIWEHFSEPANRFKYDKRYDWGKDTFWWLVTIGHINDRPICVSLSYIMIDGHPVIFWDATSQLVDHGMIDDWFKKELPTARRTDAMNAHIAFHGIDRLHEDKIGV